MANPAVKWTKAYRLIGKDWSYKAFISEHVGRGFFATVLYYRTDGARTIADEHYAANVMQDHTEAGKTEDEAFNKLKMWLNANAPGEYSIKESPLE